MEYGLISSTVASEEEEENAIVIDHNNCACYKCCTFGDIYVVDDGHCYPWNTKSEIAL